MKKYIKRMMAFSMVALLGTGVFASSVEAATLNWHLRYVKGAPSTECIYNWNKTVRTINSKATMNVSNMNGNTDVFLSIVKEDGTIKYASGVLSMNGGISGNVGKNKKIYASASLTNYGRGNANPAGNLTY